MFAQVACLVCGKPFQVAREKLGRKVPCPWCGQDTDAVPVNVEVQPLPADSSPKGKPRVSMWVAYAVLLLIVAGGVFVGLRLFGGTELVEYAVPDGSCRVLLPGSPQEVSPGPTDELFVGGRRFAATPWLGKLNGEIGWFDLPPQDAKLIRPDDLFRTLRDRRASELGATPDGEGVVKVDALSGLEVRFAGGSVRHVERYLFDPNSARPRVYWASVGGANFDPDSNTARKVLGSLRVMRDER